MDELRGKEAPAVYDDIWFYERYKMETCELCKLTQWLDIRSKLYYRDDIIYIVDCLTCGIPLIVFVRHGDATDEERRHAMIILDELFTYESVRTKARKILDHEHWHIEGKLK